LPYLIDGHNLIAALDALDLSDPDDETALLRMLTPYFARIRTKATVYFDRATPGSTKRIAGAHVTARFIRGPRSADDALRSHLSRLGKEAPNWTVVSSDREVRSAARHAGARILTSERFAAELSPQQETAQADEKPDRPLNEDEIQAWEDLFKQAPDP
jgi:predicted RNA-binding protein with PIN domain